MTKSEYARYLETPHWENLSAKTRRERLTCEDCGIDNYKSLALYKQRLHVHHKTYKNIGKEQPEDLILLCWACHLKTHGRFDWEALCDSKGMKSVRKIPLICANCTKPTGEYVGNFDEIVDVLCYECRT
jgi:hypothetical protein